jgi:hypothetical protein
MGFERREELAPTGFGVGRSFGQSRPFSVAIDLPQRHAVATRHQLVIVAVSTGQSQAAPAGAFGDRGAFDPGLFRGIGEFGQTDVSPLGESELTALIGEHADRCFHCDLLFVRFVERICERPGASEVPAARVPGLFAMKEARTG